MELTDEALRSIAGRLDWRPENEPQTMRPRSITVDQRWMVAGLAGIAERHVAWKVEGLKQPPSEISGAGYPGATLTASVKGLKYIIEEYFENKSPYASYQVFRTEAGWRERTSLGYFDNWLDNWTRR